MHRELASQSFTGHLLEMVSESSIHQRVKTTVLELMETLTKEFKGDPSLRQMERSYEIVKNQHPNLQPPEIPQKHQLTAAERQKEEEDLQLALKLSLQESEPKFSSSSYSSSSNTKPQETFSSSSSSQPQQQQQQQQKPTETAKGRTAATVNRVRALYDLTSSDPNELSFRRGDVITVIESVYTDWWKGSLKGQVGIFPLNYVAPIPDPTPEELMQEAKDEAEVFAEAKNIEKLLALLSSADSNPAANNIAENDEIQRLYKSTQAIRPRLVKLIEKYSQKRDDLIDLDKRFLSSRKTYDQLINTSLSQISSIPQQPNFSSPPGHYNSMNVNNPYAHSGQPPAMAPSYTGNAPPPAQNYQAPQPTGGNSGYDSSAPSFSSTGAGAIPAMTPTSAPNYQYQSQPQGSYIPTAGSDLNQPPRY